MSETDMTDYAEQYRAVEISDREYEYALNRMRRAYEAGFLFLNVDLDRAIRRLLRERDELAARLAAAQHQPAEGEEIMVNTPYDVFTLPLQPSGLSSGPRFVVHVPLIEAPAVKALQAEIEGLREQLRLSTVDQVNAEAEASDAHAENKRLREALEDIRSRSLVDLVMRSDHLELIALLSDIYQIADSEL